MMGDEEDRVRLEGLSEKERETEIYKRIERRDVMRKRWEIERKLRQARKAERAKDHKPSIKKKKEKKQKPATIEIDDLLIPMEVVPPMAKSRPALPVEKRLTDESGK
jgi:RNA polymerase-associated protein RTF1